MRQPTELEKSVARFLDDEFPRNIRMNRYGIDNGDGDLYIAEIPNSPWEGSTSYSTIGLSEYIHHSGDIPVRIEIIGSCLTGVESFGNVIAGCAFHSINNGNSITYGSCIQGLMDDYFVSSVLSHVTFVTPFFWETLSKKTIGDVDVLWLMALPITSAEAEYLSLNGIESLENELEKESIDIFDLERASIF